MIRATVLRRGALPASLFSVYGIGRAGFLPIRS
jgi:hypothetical protein